MFTSDQPRPSETHVLTDVGLFPLVSRLKLVIYWRFWLALHQASSDQYNGCGRIPKADLYRIAAAAYGAKYSHRQIKNLIRDGHKVFWRVKANRIVLVGYARLWSRLLQRLADETGSTDELSDYKPTPADVWLDLSGKTLQPFASRAYSAFMETRRKSGRWQVSRDLLTRMFGVSANTLIAWEEAVGMQVTPAHTQYAGSDPNFKAPAHAYLYARKNGELGLAWRDPNEYSAGVPVTRHNHIGQNRKARKVRNSTIKMLQSADKFGGGSGVLTRRYFEHDEPGKAFKNALRYARKHYTPALEINVRLGEKNTHKFGRLIVSERLDIHTDLQHTELEDRDYQAQISSPIYAWFNRQWQDSDTRQQPLFWLKSAWKFSEGTVFGDMRTPAHTRVYNPHYAVIQALDTDPLLTFALSIGASISLKTTKKTPRQSAVLADASATTEPLGEGVSNLPAFNPNAGSVAAYKNALLNQLAQLRHTKIPKITLNRLKSALCDAGQEMSKLEAIWSEIRQIKRQRQEWATV